MSSGGLFCKLEYYNENQLPPSLQSGQQPITEYMLLVTASEAGKKLQC